MNNYPANPDHLMNCRASVLEKAIDGYSVNASSFGISQDQLIQDGAAFHQAGVAVETQNFILTDPQGPLIANHLAKQENMVVLDKIRQMTPTQAAAFIATEIRPKLAGTGNETKAPKPVEIINGGGAPKQETAFVQGATFE